MEEILSCKVMTETVLKDNLEPSDIQPETVLLEGVRSYGMYKEREKRIGEKRDKKLERVRNVRNYRRSIIRRT